MQLDKLTLKNALEFSVREYSSQRAMGFVGEEAMTYKDFGERVEEVREFLLSLGIRFGDRVAILGENMPNWGVVYFATTTMGAVAVPILPEFHSSAVHHIIRHSEAKAVFVSSRLMEKIEEGSLPTVKTVVQLEDLTPLKEEPEVSEHPEKDEREPFKDAIRSTIKEFEKLKANAVATLEKSLDESFDGLHASPRREKIMKVFQEGMKRIENMREMTMKSLEKKPVELSEDDVAAIIYTSGTTGSSKGVVLTHKNLVSNALGTIKLASFKPGERMVSILPLSHTYECTLGLILPIIGGGEIYYLSKPPTPRILLPAMTKVRPTFMLAVPLVIEKIYKNRIQPNLLRNSLMRNAMKLAPIRKKLHQVAGRKLIEAFGGELRCMCIGGAPLSPEVEFFLREAGFPYSIGYGLTETSPLVTGVMPELAKYRSCGPVLDGVRVRIVDPHPDTGEGEIQVKGPSVMKEYYKAPQVTEEAFTEDGWFKTGDLGVMDEDDFLYIKGRSKNMILGPSGENIYPEEIEAVISEYEFVLESLVFEQNNKLVARVHLDYEKLDETLKGKKTESQLREEVDNILKDLKARVNQRVSSFSKLSAVVEQTEPFEKTPTMKIKRYMYVE